MTLKYVLSFAVVIALSFSATSQKLKVKRKGVTSSQSNKKVIDRKSKYSLEQFNGKWQEVKRTNRTNSSVDFKDTLFYTFKDSVVISRDGVNMSMKGEASIEPDNVLVAAADVFTIRSMTNNQVVLDDGEYIHTLDRKKEFWSETLPSNTVEPEKFITPIAVDAQALLGKWRVYRRDAKPGVQNKALIRMISVHSIKKDNSATGEITFYNMEKVETLPCTVILTAEKMIISAGKNIWNLNIYKADGKDLVFGDSTLMYYCKPL